jgi:peptidoglycan/xylan/chitin deacetylase (PgdA/CDA1 family)
MESLRSWGYTAITPTHLLEVLFEGGVLPPRPVVITFDDGWVDVYENAYPIMKEMGFVGAVYLVGNYKNAKGCLSVDQLKELAGAGWELGSHSMSHPNDLRYSQDLQWEVQQSQIVIEEAVGVEVTTFAYPYGWYDGKVATMVSQYYFGALALGGQYTHRWSTIYALNRIEVKVGIDLDAFASLLPWWGPLEEPTPTPTSTVIP